MSTYYSSYYSDYYSSYSTPGFTTGSPDDSECMNYIYLVWVYFLFYVGAGYPTYYYPYLIATLLDSVPQQCGGTGDESESGGPGLDTSLLTALSLQQPGTGGGVSIGGFNGYSPGGYGSSGYVVQQPAASSGLSGDLSSYGIQQPQVVMPNTAIGTGKRKRSIKNREIKNQVLKQTQKLLVKTTKNGKKKKSKRKKEVKTNKKVKKKQKNQKNTAEKKNKRKEQRTQIRQANKQAKRKKKNKRKRSKSKKVAKRKNKRKEQRTQIRQATKQAKRKGKNKRGKSKGNKLGKIKNKNVRQHRRQEKRKQIRRARRSKLGKQIPTKQLKMVKQYFVKGKLKAEGKLSILKGIEFPYNKKGKLRRRFRRLVKSKWIERLPDYCEQAKLASPTNRKSKKRKDCQRRAERIKQRVRERMKM